MNNNNINKWIAAFVLGVTMLWFLSLRWPWWSYVIIITAGISVLRWRLLPWIVLLSGFVVGWTYAFLWVEYQAQQYLPRDNDGQVISAEGYVVGMPENDSYRLSFQYKATRVCVNGACIKRNALLQLSWYGAYPQLQPGQRWRLQLKVRRPHGLANPGGFDYERYLWQQGIVGRGYVRSGPLNYRLSGIEPRQWINHWRYQLKQSLLKRMGKTPFDGIVLALLLGDRDHISVKQWQLFRDTGTSHLMAISGLHIGLMAMLFFYLSLLVTRCFPRCCLYIPARSIAAISAILGAAAYSALAGFSVSTQRALVMVSIVMLAQLLKRIVSPLTLWCYALFVVLLLDPFAILSTGFWLSFYAVFLIVYVMAYRVARLNKWQQIFRIQGAIFIGMLPLSLFYFQQISLIAGFANLLAIPWASFVVVPLSVLSLLLLGVNGVNHYLLLGVQYSIHWMLIFLQYCQASHLYWHLGVNGVLGFACLLLALLLLLLPKAWPMKSIASVWLIVAVFINARHFHPDWLLRLTVLDVGQGLATVIETKQHVYLYDTGIKFSDTSDSGINVIVPYLHRLGIRKLDTIVISHGDNDHKGGMASILHQYPHTKVMTSDPHIIKQFHPSETCVSGQQWQVDNVNFKMLYPQAGQAYKVNESSCVLQIQVGQQTILLPGDLEAGGEKRLVNSQRALLKASIIVAPHHGSITSSTPKFVAAVHPEYVVYPMGWHNRYGFPSKKVQQRYKKVGAKAYKTAETGAIQFIITANQSIIGPVFYRFNHLAIWNKINQ